MIFGVLDSVDTFALVNREVIWMPSHCSPAAIGTRFRSDGKYMTAIDWRANRLVDCLAKMAAMSIAVPDLALSTLHKASKVAEYFAAQLGAITHCANHYPIDVVRKDGTLGKSFIRESNPGKRPKRTFKGPAVTAEPPMEPTPLVDEPRAEARRITQAEPRLIHSHSQAAARAHAQHRDIVRKGDQRGLDYWRENCDKRKAPAPPPISAADRLSALRSRVLGTS
jgi:hypothetical protein